LGRFYGSQKGLAEFKLMAESAYLAVREFNACLPEDHGFHGWLNLIHDMARAHPTPLLRSRHSVWGLDTDPDVNELCRVVEHWHQPAEGAAFPLNPICNTLVHTVFTSSMAAIELILDSKKALLVGDTWFDCFPFNVPYQPPIPNLPIMHEGQTTNAIESKGKPEPPPAEEIGPKVYVSMCRSDRGTWRCTFKCGNSKEEVEIASTVNGVAYCQVLLEKPDCPIPPLDVERHAGIIHPLGKRQALEDEVTGDPEDRGPRRAYGDNRDRSTDNEGLAMIDEEIARLTKEVEDTVSPDRQRELAGKICEIQVYRGRMVNKKGQPRFRGELPDEERARKRVNNALRRAVEMISKAMPAFAKYLEQTIRGEDGSFVYRPGKAFLE